MAILDGTILKVVVSLLLPDSVIAQNVFYSVVTDLVTSQDELDVVTDLVTWVETMYTELNTRISTTASSSDIKVYEYDANDEDWDEVGTDVWTDGFSNVEDMLPHGCAALLHARTTDPDTQASKYIAGFSEVSCLDSDLNAPVITDLGDFGEAWVTAFVGTETGGTFGPGVWSTADAVFKLFSGTYVVNGLISYQRRRKPGVGI
jgi:hypothetical protein